MVLLNAFFEPVATLILIGGGIMATIGLTRIYAKWNQGQPVWGDVLNFVAGVFIVFGAIYVAKTLF